MGVDRICQYDALEDPLHFGSGGGAGPGTGQGGNGGGLLRLRTPLLLLDGQLSADGLSGSESGLGGAGGAIWIEAGTIQGAGLTTGGGFGVGLSGAAACVGWARLL